MPANVSVEVDEAELERILLQAAVPEVTKVTQRTQTGAKRRAPVDTGLLRSSIYATVRVSPPLVVGEVGSNLEYAIYVHEGTGIYGPSGKPITPKRSRVLVFKVRGKTVFAHSVKGQRPQPFLVDALEWASPWPVVPG